MSRYRDPQLEVGGIYSYLFNLGTNIGQFRDLDTHFVPNDSDLVGSYEIIFLADQIAVIENEMSFKTSRFTNVWSLIKQI